MPLFHVKPRPIGDDPDEVVRIRDPATGQPLAPQGVTVEWSTFWQARLQDGDITREKPPVAEPGEASDVGVCEHAPPPSKTRAPKPTPAISAEKED